MDPPDLPPVRPILERCLLGDNDAWIEFLARYKELIRQAFGTSSGGLKYEQFADGFPGWLFAHRKLHALYRAVLGRIEAGELLADGEEGYVRNYLVGMVRSAVSDWFRGHRDLPMRAVPESDLPPEEEFAEAVDQIREALRELPIELRVPFWVRHVRAFGPLPLADLEWLAAIAKRPAAEVARAIADEADAQPDPDRPLSSRFIADLLRLPPLANGKAAAVDQRVRRARKLLRDRFRPEG